MKHLLILISILLLSSPVIGDNHKGETLYKWKNPSGDGYVWKGFGDKETHSVYQGDVKNGKPDGLGIMIDIYGGKYIGEWKNGKRNGKGKLTYPDGEKMEGDWKDDLLHGKGTRSFPVGLKYVGEYKNGIRHGQGTQFHPYGWKYIGKWNNGLMWNGIRYDKNGEIEYEYVNGKIQ